MYGNWKAGAGGKVSQASRIPPSPVTNPVDLKKCIELEELVKFTPQSHVNGTLEWDIGLSEEFCPSLINHQSSEPIFPSAWYCNFTVEVEHSIIANFATS
ncbi:hypothetical protein CCACVL1_07418 [Corchorus capsularis]|uniref:Uncharacterized protein n=1 Tax=Corchorus capsularis TaxID=210143 RepID=A0A1R3J650_COCAP|nr:hypothetical protein CCACVL1_07418 [Corchorus capsularis]